MPSISAFLINYNNGDIVETALRSLRFVDQLVVIDKSSTDGSDAICRRYADEFLTVPWSPTVEATRKEAFARCIHDAIIFLDGDECFSPAGIEFMRTKATGLDCDILAIPMRHYILGRHSENAYHWPEYHNRFFRRGALEFRETVHGGVLLKSDRIQMLPPDSPCCIHHLSHANASVWLEKTNRYTSQEDRAHDFQYPRSLVEYADARLSYWKSRLKANSGQYEAAVMLLRLIYDLADAVKVIEQTLLPDGVEEFRRICAELNASYDELTRDSGITTTVPHDGAEEVGEPPDRRQSRDIKPQS